MNSDFKELLSALNEQGVEYLIVGGYAVIFHTEPRFTRDLEIWVKPDPDNAARLMVGAPPVALDLLTSIGGLDFAGCWNRRVVDENDGVADSYLGRDDLIQSKEIADRDQDRADIRKLRGPGSDG